jgi:small subunit ribosomal protein S6
MAQDAPLYDLTLMLTLDASEEQRAKVLSDVEKSIGTAGGSIERNDDWGRRPLAFQIRHQPEADYHLLQFKAPSPFIEELSHTLRITDGVLRFRVIKVRPGTPPAPSSPPPVVVAAPPAAASSTSAGGGTDTATEAPPATAAASADAEPPAPEDATAPPATEDAAAPPAPEAAAPPATEAPAAPPPEANGAEEAEQDSAESEPAE